MSSKARVGRNALEKSHLSDLVEETSPRKERTTKQRSNLSANVDAEIMQRVRNVVFYTPGATVTSFVEQALLHEVERLEKERGEAFPQATGKVKTGRPLSMAKNS